MKTQIAELLQQLCPRPDGQAQPLLQRLSGGASQETWLFHWIDTPSHAPSQRFVLRRAAPGSNDRSGLSVGLPTEVALLKCAASAGVPVPKVYRELTSAQGLGQGFVAEYLEGHTLGQRVVKLAELAQAREKLAYQCGQTLAKLHAISRADLPRLNYANASTTLGILRQQHYRYGQARPMFELAFQVIAAKLSLADYAFDESQACLVHGDFRNGNLMINEQGLAAVLDWELAHLGDPMEDLAWVCVNSWRFGQTHLPVGGFGSREQLYAGYSDAGGHIHDQRLHLHSQRAQLWELIGTLKWGVICEGMGHAWLTGAEPDIEKAAIGRRASETELDILALIEQQG